MGGRIPLGWSRAAGEQLYNGWHVNLSGKMRGKTFLEIREFTRTKCKRIVTIGERFQFGSTKKLFTLLITDSGASASSSTNPSL